MKNSLKQKSKSLLLFFGASFLLHLLWENLQAPLFEGFVSSKTHFLVCLYATATGDMIFMALIYVSLVCVHKNLWWILRKESYSHIATWVLPIIIGGLLAMSYELWAIYVEHRWEYGDMPLIPHLGVGIFPILQMIFIPLGTLKICQIVFQKNNF
jgi:hypothetical protein